MQNSFESDYATFHVYILKILNVSNDMINFTVGIAVLVACLICHEVVFISTATSVGELLTSTT